MGFIFFQRPYPVMLIASQFGISDNSGYSWGKNNRKHGEQGLLDKSKTTTGFNLPEAVRKSIVDLKTANFDYCEWCIGDILKRFFPVGTHQ
jgi:hypothetical protein